MKHLGYKKNDWAYTNPVLPVRVMGFELDTLRFKIGDGVTTWNDLEYAAETDPNDISRYDLDLPEDWINIYDPELLTPPTITSTSIDTTLTTIVGLADVGVTVKLSKDDREEVASTVADATGEYTFSIDRQLESGEYTIRAYNSVEVQPCGFATILVDDVYITVGHFVKGKEV